MSASIDRLLTTATSIEEGERKAQLAVLPVGSFEQHGSHLPLMTDTLVACAIAKAVADEYNLFLLPRSPSPAPTSTPLSRGPSASAPPRSTP